MKKLHRKRALRKSLSAMPGDIFPDGKMKYFLRKCEILLPQYEICLRHIAVSLRDDQVKTTGLAGGLHRPYKGLIQPRLKTHERFANRKLFTGCPLPGAALYLPLATGSPVNGSLNSLRHIWSLAMSSWSWLRTYSFIVFSLRPTVST